MPTGYGHRPGTDRPKPGQGSPGTQKPGTDRPGYKDEDKDGGKGEDKDDHKDEYECKDKRFDFHRITNVLSDMFGTMVGGGKPDMDKMRFIYQYLAEIYEPKEDEDCDMDVEDMFTTSRPSTRSPRTTDISVPTIPSTVEPTVPSTISFTGTTRKPTGENN